MEDAYRRRVSQHRGPDEANPSRLIGSPLASALDARCLSLSLIRGAPPRPPLLTVGSRRLIRRQAGRSVTGDRIQRINRGAAREKVRGSFPSDFLSSGRMDDAGVVGIL